MAERRPAAPPAAAVPATAVCPPVADLINYALGRPAGDARRAVEAHLNGGGCPDCRRWVEKAARSGNEMDVDLETNSPLSAEVPSRSPSPALSADFTPLPTNAKWRRDAFRDLEKRLRALDENYS